MIAQLVVVSGADEALNRLDLMAGPGSGVHGLLLLGSEGHAEQRQIVFGDVITDRGGEND